MSGAAASTAKVTGHKLILLPFPFEDRGRFMANAKRSVFGALLLAGLIGCGSHPPPKVAPFRLARGEVAGYFVNEVDPAFWHVTVALTPQASARYTAYVHEWYSDHVIALYLGEQIVGRTSFADWQEQIRCAGLFPVSTRARVETLIKLVKDLNPDAVEIDRANGASVCYEQDSAE
jgi:hypothetical protein